MAIQLSDHFTYKKLFRFTLPSIAMMIFTSVYGVVDGFFVSNFAGKTPFAALNFIIPFIMVLGAAGFMFGAGGSALISKTMGEGQKDRANRLFSLFVVVPAALSVVLALLGILFLPQVAAILGAGDLLADCVLYGRILLLALPAFTLQMEFQTFFVTAEKPQLGFLVTVAAGVANMVLDALFVAGFRWGLAGAAAATALSQLVGGVIPLVYFFCPNSSLLRLGKPTWDGRALLKGTTNGFSELLSNISMSLVGMLYNMQLMRYAGENGVAAYGAILYVDFIFVSVFIGYSVGTAPVIGYHYGAGGTGELKNLYKKSLVLMAAFGVGMFALAQGLATPLGLLFTGYDAALFEMTVHGFRLYAFSFLTVGFAIFGSSFFTALNNGLISALISFLRTVLFEVVCLFLFPRFFELDGIWYGIILSRALSLSVTFAFLAGFRRHYQY